MSYCKTDVIIFAASSQTFDTAQKMKFSIKDFFSKYDKFTKEILNEKLHFLCSVTET